MDKKYDIYIGGIDVVNYCAAQAATIETLNAWLAKGYRIETKHQIGWFLHEVYLVGLADI